MLRKLWIRAVSNFIALIPTLFNLWNVGNLNSYYFIQVHKDKKKIVLLCSRYLKFQALFYVYLNLTGILLFPNLAKFRDTAPLKGKIRKFHVAPYWKI